MKSRGGRVDWRDLLGRLGQMGIVRVLVEGGREVADSAIAAGVVNEINFFVAPKLIGGTQKIAKALKIKDLSIRTVDGDLLLSGIL